MWDQDPRPSGNMNLLVVAALLVDVAAVIAFPLPPASPSPSSHPLLSARLVEELTYLGKKERRRKEEERREHRDEGDGGNTQRDEKVHQHHKSQPHLHEGFGEKYPKKHHNTAKKSKTKNKPVTTGKNLINAEEVQWTDEEKRDLESPWEDMQETTRHSQEEATGKHISGYEIQNSLREKRRPWEKEDDVMEGPLVLPVTEWKKTQYPDLPEELLPIRPGGGSRFEDLEREKLEKEKMSQTKGVEEDTTDTATSHDMESLSSCTASLCLSFLILFFTSLRMLI